MKNNIYISHNQFAERLGVNRCTLYRWLKTDPNFPKEFKFSPGCVRFKMADVEVWEKSRV